MAIFFYQKLDGRIPLQRLKKQGFVKRGFTHELNLKKKKKT